MSQLMKPLGVQQKYRCMHAYTHMCSHDSHRHTVQAADLLAATTVLEFQMKQI